MKIQLLGHVQLFQQLPLRHKQSLSWSKMQFLNVHNYFLMKVQVRLIANVNSKKKQKLEEALFEIKNIMKKLSQNGVKRIVYLLSIKLIICISKLLNQKMEQFQQIVIYLFFTFYFSINIKK